MTDLDDHTKPSNKDRTDHLISSDASLVLGLSLFIILLAFFIVLNGLSQYSEPKVGRALESLETAFAQTILPSETEKSSMDERAQDDTGQGDAVKELEGVLKSLLPNLNMVANPNSNGGSTMAVRMEKGQFERLSNNLIPLFVRILTEKDAELSYGLTFTSYVRNPFGPKAIDSLNMLNGYMNDMLNAGLPSNRMGLNIDQGNPAIIMITFESLPKGLQ